jgi:hypothetical protein
MLNSKLIQLALLIAILVTIFSKLFYLAIFIGICWGGWLLFINSDTYNKYSK